MVVGGGELLFSRLYASDPVLGTRAGLDRVKLDIRQLPPQRVLGIALPADRQDQQNVTKLKGLSRDGWASLVDLIAMHRYYADPNQIRKICGIKPANEEQQTNGRYSPTTRASSPRSHPGSFRVSPLLKRRRPCSAPAGPQPRTVPSFPGSRRAGDRFEWAREVVRPALAEILGPEGSGWRTERRPRPDRPGASQRWKFRDMAGCPPTQWLAEEFRFVQALTADPGE